MLTLQFLAQDQQVDQLAIGCVCQAVLSSYGLRGLSVTATIEPDASVEQEKEEKRIVIDEFEKRREHQPNNEDKEEVHGCPLSRSIADLLRRTGFSEVFSGF